MHQVDNANIIRLPSLIARLWKKYHAAGAVTQRVDARRIELEVTGDANEIDRAGAACDFAYDDLTGISEAILRSRPTGLVDVAIQAQVIARRRSWPTLHRRRNFGLFSQVKIVAACTRSDPIRTEIQDAADL